MDKSTSVHLDDDDQVRVVHQVRHDRLDGYPLLWIKSRSREINTLDIFPGIAGLRRIVAEGAAYLAEHDEEGNRRIMDRAGVVPTRVCPSCGSRPVPVCGDPYHDVMPIPAEATKKVYVIEEGPHGVTWGVEERPVAAEACFGPESLPDPLEAECRELEDRWAAAHREGIASPDEIAAGVRNAPKDGL